MCSLLELLDQAAALQPLLTLLHLAFRGSSSTVIRGSLQVWKGRKYNNDTVFIEACIKSELTEGCLLILPLMA